MTRNDMMTAGAAAFALFALWWITKPAASGARPYSSAVTGYPQGGATMPAWLASIERNTAELSRGLDYSFPHTQLGA